MKKAKNLLLAAAMSMSALSGAGVSMINSVAPAMAYTEDAENGKTITITDSTDATKTYKAYQIFKGDYAVVDNEKKLSNLKWGDDVDSTTKAGNVDSFVETNNTSNATMLAAVKALYSENHLSGGQEMTYSEGTYTLTNVPAGYYLIVDETSIASGANAAKSASIVKIVGDDVTLKQSDKYAIPTVDKSVQDENTEDGKAITANTETTYGEVADHAINEKFNFKLEGSVYKTEGFLKYETYMVNFKDQMSSGVSFSRIVSVKVNNNTLSAEDYTVTYKNGENVVEATNASGQAGLSFELKIDDIRQSEDEWLSGLNTGDEIKIEVVYEAYLNEAAKVTNASGEYKASGDNVTNYNYVSLEYSNNPEVSGSGDSSTGETGKDYVWVFSYKVNNVKVDADNTETKLKDAKFKLKYQDNTEVSLIYDSELKAYRPTKGDEIAAEYLVSSDNNEILGQFNIVGLDAGTYTLTEVEAPTGYNKAEDTTITILPTSHQENDDKDGAILTMNENAAVNNTIEDKIGSVLPTTGGMGTTIFYTAGGIMVAGAAILMVTKKRMDHEE